MHELYYIFNFTRALNIQSFCAVKITHQKLENYYLQEFMYSWLSSATRTFMSTEMKRKTIGEQAHAHSQLPLSH